MYVNRQSLLRQGTSPSSPRTCKSIARRFVSLVFFSFKQGITTPRKKIEVTRITTACCRNRHPQRSLKNKVYQMQRTAPLKRRMRRKQHEGKGPEVSLSATGEWCLCNLALRQTSHSYEGPKKREPPSNGSRDRTKNNAGPLVQLHTQGKLCLLLILLATS